ncbi:hypothetical protein Bca52824_016251 [Brassica carinata]|uniref:GH10 domain-containing protein n=1 Tax=Brassica carinata TaxID=52824 RepID=A0A8X7W6N3_BRACI|nr:hypothetical protein Bca52824_016251 [Brassica carinata]
MELPQTINTGEGFQELKIKENKGNGKVVERVSLQKGNVYSISAWIKLRNEKERAVRITLRGKNVRYFDGGQVMAKKGCWSLLKGGFIVNVSAPVDISSSDGLAAAEINVQNVRLQRFNKTQWRLQQDQVIEKLAEKNKVLVKGHTVLWDDKKWQPIWVKSITDPEGLRNVTLNRINSIMRRYKGRLIGWDVMNENLHYSYYEDMLGKNASAMIYSLASKIDPNVPLFINEYNTIEYAKGVGSPINVKNKMEEIVSYPGNMNIKGGIGAQAHFVPAQPNLPYMRSALDTLGSLGFPVWLTEVDMPKCPDQASHGSVSVMVKYMEEVLREAYSHPGVEGIILYAGPEMSGFNKLTLADKDFNNTEAGDLTDKLLQEWQQEPAEIPVKYHEHNDEEQSRIIGFSPEVSLLHGHYTVIVTNPWMKNLSTSFRLEVTKESGHLQVVQFELDV